MILTVVETKLAHQIHYISVFIFVLKSILSDICIAIPDLNWFTYLNLISVFYKQHIFGSCFSIQSNNQCSSYGVFNLFTFNVIINMLRLLYAILLFVFYTCHLFFCYPIFLLLCSFLLSRYFSRVLFYSHCCL